MRAPQYGKVRMPVGPNPMASAGLRVAPLANIFALIEGLGCISLHRTEADAKTALEGEIERRRQFNERHSGEGVNPASPAQADEPHDAEADR